MPVTHCVAKNPSIVHIGTVERVSVVTLSARVYIAVTYSVNEHPVAAASCLERRSHRGSECRRSTNSMQQHLAAESITTTSVQSRRLSSVGASVRPCACCQQALQPKVAAAASLSQRQPDCRTRYGVTRGQLTSISSNRRQLVVRAGGPAGGLGGHAGGRGEPVDTWPKKILLGVALAYISLMVILPFVNVFIQAFAKGIGPFLEAVMEHDFIHAAKLTLMLAAIAVPLNTIFGTVAAVLITRNEFPGKVLLLSLLDLPFSISPVVTGLMLMLLYGRAGWFAQFLAQNGINIVFAFPGMAIATMFITLPFIVRELIPTLEQMDLAQEEAAKTLGANPLQVFWHVTLPNIRWGLMYGVILTNARAMGEFGAVSVISGNIIGRTQTLTLFVESAYKEYNSEAAFAAAVLLSCLALATLWVKDKVEQAAAAEAAK